MGDGKVKPIVWTAVTLIGFVITGASVIIAAYIGRPAPVPPVPTATAALVVSTTTATPTSTPSSTNKNTPPPSTETRTATPTSTAVLPTSTNSPQPTATFTLVPSTPTNTTQPTITATVAPPIAQPTPTNTSQYLCEGQTYSISGADIISAVRRRPSENSPSESPVRAETPIFVLEISDHTDVWYQIANKEGEVLGWLRSEHIRLDTECDN